MARYLAWIPARSLSINAQVKLDHFKHYVFDVDQDQTELRFSPRLVFTRKRSPYPWC